MARCIYCGSATVPYDAPSPTCGGCAVLLDGIARPDPAPVREALAEIQHEDATRCERAWLAGRLDLVLRCREFRHMALYH